MKKNRFSLGTVYLVGAGPGDPGLLTVRGAQLLRRSDAVVADALVPRSLLAGLRAKIYDVGKRGPGAPEEERRSMSQDAINRLLIRLARRGRSVVRLKGGDPFVFGRGSEETDALRLAGIPYEVVPGVSAAVAVPAAVGIPITDRRFASHVTFITGQERTGKKGANAGWSRLAPDGTLVVFMGVHAWPGLCRRLLRSGWNPGTPVMAIENGTLAAQRRVATTLDDSVLCFRDAALRSPSLIVVGKVAASAPDRARFDPRRPLRGRDVILTRPGRQSDALNARLAQLGARVAVHPMIRIEALPKRLNAIFTVGKKPRSAFDRVIFLSANAVRLTARALGKRRSRLLGVPMIAVGPATAAAVKAAGWTARVTSSPFNAKNLARQIGDVRGLRVLLPRVEGGPQDVVLDLKKRGALVTEVEAYRSVPQPLDAAARRGLAAGIDVVVFTSASTVRALLAALNSSERKRFIGRTAAVAIGPSTAEALHRSGVRRITIAPEATEDGLVQAVLRALPPSPRWGERV